jgi:hypothetical protein
MYLLSLTLNQSMRLVETNMWFITTLKSKVEFYNPKGIPVEVSEIEWVNEIEIKDNNSGVYTYIASSKPFIKDHSKTISILLNTGINGFNTKVESKKFAKTLTPGTWKYLHLNNIEAFVSKEAKGK